MVDKEAEFLHCGLLNEQQMCLLQDVFFMTFPHGSSLTWMSSLRRNIPRHPMNKEMTKQTYRVFRWTHTVKPYANMFIQKLCRLRQDNIKVYSVRNVRRSVKFYWNGSIWCRFAFVSGHDKGFPDFIKSINLFKSLKIGLFKKQQISSNLHNLLKLLCKYDAWTEIYRVRETWQLPGSPQNLHSITYLRRNFSPLQNSLIW
jgi:hypothetical protein